MLFCKLCIKLCKSLIMIEILQQILLKDTKQAIDILVLLNIIVFPTCFLMYLLLNIYANLSYKKM
uniref:Uncharacterized protein n=1 Tax=Iridovirus sp. TaxID=135728 RepID=A0AAU7YBZ6_9VIRU